MSCPRGLAAAVQMRLRYLKERLRLLAEHPVARPRLALQKVGRRQALALRHCRALISLVWFVVVEVAVSDRKCSLDPFRMVVEVAEA